MGSIQVPGLFAASAPHPCRLITAQRKADVKPRAGEVKNKKKKNRRKVWVEAAGQVRRCLKESKGV